jgi:hypothetical protein
MIGNYDSIGDQQGNIGGDIVGSGTNYGLFMTFNNNGSTSNTDGTLGFRLRLDTVTPPANNPQFDRAAWIGIDADLNGSVDVFIGVNKSGNASSLGIYATNTAVANDSPNSTAISSTASSAYVIGASNFNFRAVNFNPTNPSSNDGVTTNDASPATSGDPDYYVSFMVPFADVVGFLATKSINITDQSSLRYVAATSTSGNNLNQDLAGISGQVGSNSTWVALGGFTQVVNASGTVVVPEPSTSLLGLAGFLFAVTRRKRTAQ